MNRKQKVAVVVALALSLASCGREDRTAAPRQDAQEDQQAITVEYDVKPYMDISLPEPEDFQPFDMVATESIGLFRKIEDLITFIRSTVGTESAWNSPDHAIEPIGPYRLEVTAPPEIHKRVRVLLAFFHNEVESWMPYQLEEASR